LIGRVRSQLKESAAQLAVEQQRYSDLVAEQFQLSQEILAGARAAWRERKRLNALNKRLRSERDQARDDSLRFNEERNALRREVAELRSRRSEAAVRDATRTRLSFPGTRAE
jgi:chromosome segregation ATPase